MATEKSVRQRFLRHLYRQQHDAFAERRGDKAVVLVKPRRVIVETARKLKSPKVLVPLAVAVGVGVAAVTRLLNGHKTNGTALPRLGKNLSPHFSHAVHALADLGRELRAKVR